MPSAECRDSECDGFARRALQIVSLLPGAYAVLAFGFAKRVIVRGRSMVPALSPGERLLFDRLAYVRGEPRVGDIVLARHAARPGVRFIKRVAVVGGDGGYVLLGDNPDESTDSRTVGPFRLKDIVGRGWMVYWPAEQVRVIKRS